MKNIIFTLVLLVSLSSCIGAKMTKLEGKTKFEMLNKLGSPVKIISSNNGETIYVYFYEDYSANNYPSVVGLMYVNSNDRIVSVQKEKTRLSLSEFLYFKNLN
jgi:hypothetical protein|tara:strand:- start:39 stop:347 length:309 start_codon:yes stop_codon:yes gene_type:complete